MNIYDKTDLFYSLSRNFKKNSSNIRIMRKIICGYENWEEVYTFVKIKSKRPSPPIPNAIPCGK